MNTTVLLADTAEATGVVVGRIIFIAIAVALVVFGIRMIGSATTGGRRALGIVMLVLGVLFLLGTLVSLVGGGAATA